MKIRAIRDRLRQVWRFVSEDVWDVDLGSLSLKRSFAVRAIRVVSLVVKGFREDECPLHASALTFNTLMAIVPILALSLTLARGLGGSDVAKNWIRGTVAEWTQAFDSKSEAPPRADNAPALVTSEAGIQPVAGGKNISRAELAQGINGLVERAFENVENISFTALGGLGLILLLWMVISVLGGVEASFNRVWGVKVGRSFWRKFTDYLSVLIILPFLIIAASSLPVVDLVSRFVADDAASVIRSVVGSTALKNLTVGLMTSLSFAFVIAFMPNTRVKLLPGLVGGIVAGLLFLGWLWVCALLQVGAARAGKIYGSFAVVPIVLAWVYVSWQIVLFGAEVAFGMQNYKTYRMEQGSKKANVHARMIMALSLVAEAVRATMGKGGGLEVDAYARTQQVPIRLLNEVLDDLVSAGLLAELSGDCRRLVLLKSPRDVSVHDVVDVVMQAGVKPESLGLRKASPAISRAVETVTAGQSSSSLSIQDLVEDAGCQMESSLKKT